MEIGQQLILIFMGIAIGLLLGIILGVVIQRNRDKPRQPAEQQAQTDLNYGTVNPDSIHTLPTEASQAGQQVNCPVCGHNNPPDNMFCFDCGGRLR